jgi:hypothetical protein
MIHYELSFKTQVYNFDNDYTRRCIISQKSADVINIAVEAWNHDYI